LKQNCSGLFPEHSDSGRESFVIRVAGPPGAGILISQPADSAPLDSAALEALGAAPEKWTQLPAGVGSGPWLIATAEPRDGHRLQVGKTTEAQQALLEHFRIVSRWVLTLGLSLGLSACWILAFPAEAIAGQCPCPA